MKLDVGSLDLVDPLRPEFRDLGRDGIKQIILEGYPNDCPEGQLEPCTDNKMSAYNKKLEPEDIDSLVDYVIRLKSLSDVEYRATRTQVGEFNVWPDADEKLLVVHFSAENTLPAEQQYHAVKWIAEMADGQRFEEVRAYLKSSPSQVPGSAEEPAASLP